MELQKFISESIKQICFGIRDVKKEINTNSANAVAEEMNYGMQEKICFDIAVTITEDDRLKAAGSVNIKIADGDLEKEKSKTIQNIHRINFQAPFTPNNC